MSKKQKGGKSLRVHDFKVSKLRDILVAEWDYDNILDHVEYGPRTHVVGEVDILGIDGNWWDFFEVKCNDSNKLYRKALEQYQRFKRFYGNRVREGYFYCGDEIINMRDLR